MSEQTVHKAITAGTINITKGCIHTITDEAFKRKKSGRVRRTSMEETIKERRGTK